MGQDETRAYLEAQRKRGLRPGDMVKVMRKTTSYHEGGWCNAWVTSMDNSVGKVLRVKAICKENGVTLEDGHNFDYPHFVLRRVRKAVKK